MRSREEILAALKANLKELFPVSAKSMDEIPESTTLDYKDVVDVLNEVFSEMLPPHENPMRKPLFDANCFRLRLEAGALKITAGENGLSPVMAIKWLEFLANEEKTIITKVLNECGCGKCVTEKEDEDKSEEPLTTINLTKQGVTFGQDVSQEASKAQIYSYTLKDGKVYVHQMNPDEDFILNVLSNVFDKALEPYANDEEAFEREKRGLIKMLEN